MAQPPGCARYGLNQQSCQTRSCVEGATIWLFSYKVKPNFFDCRQQFKIGKDVRSKLETVFWGVIRKSSLKHLARLGCEGQAGEE